MLLGSWFSEGSARTSQPEGEADFPVAVFGSYRPRSTPYRLPLKLPPLEVFWQRGLTKHFWLNILLTILGYVPGLVHAVWVIAKYK